MSATPPQGPDQGEPELDRPADLLAVEGLEPQRATPPGSVLSLRDPDGTGETGDDVDGGADRYDVESLPRGTQLGRYVLLGRVAEDRGVGVVYGAYDPKTDHRVTIKLFNPGGDEGTAHATQLRLAQQGQALAKLSHPCVERIHEAGLYGPWVFLVTEFIDGIDLRDWMEVRDEPFPWPEVLRVFREAGRGLAAAHQLGIVHRDFRPSNVLMGKEGRLVVIDFGLAPEVAEEPGDVEAAELRVSLGGAVSSEETVPDMAGTPAYMAPEQHLTGHADARSDQFSFCVALYEALYGERPFSGNRPRAIALEAAKHNVRPAPPGSDVPAWLRTAVIRGLHPRPSERFGSMEALLRELDRDPARRRRRWAWGAALAGGVAGLGGLMAVQLEADEAACGGTGGALTEIWTTDRRQRLREAFEATGRPWAAPSWRYTEAKLDAFGDSWRNYSRLACLATRVWGDAAERTYDLRVACLDRTLAEFEATMDVLERVDGPMLDHAHLVAQDLPEPRWCTDTATLLALGAPPEELATEVDALHAEFAALQARLALGDVAAARREALELQPRVAATDDEALRARAELVLGQAQLAAGDAEAEPSLHHAARAALVAGDQGLAAATWLVRMDALVGAGRSVEAVALGDYVSGVVEHKRIEWMRTRLEIARGQAEHARGRPVEALARFHAAMQSEEDRADTDRLRLLPAWSGQAQVLAERDELDEAVAPLQVALDVTREALGPTHPAQIPLLHAIGRLQLRQDRLADARSSFDTALETQRRTNVAAPELVAELACAVGAIDAGTGDASSASLYFERADVALQKAAASNRVETLRGGLALARGLLDLDHGAEARSLLLALVARPEPSRARPGWPEVVAAEVIEAELLVRATTMWDDDDQEFARRLVSGTMARLEGAPAYLALQDEAARWLEEHPLP